MNTLSHRLNLPITPAVSHRIAKADSLDRINTQYSTQQTARQSTNRNSNQNAWQLHRQKNHITLLEQLERDQQSREVSGRRSSSRQANKQQRQFQYYRKVQNDKQQIGSSSQRRRKIFDQNYRSNKRPSISNYKVSVSSGNFQPAQPPPLINPVKFIDTIPVVQNRFIKVSSLSRLHHTQALPKGPNKITFTYTQPSVFHQSQDRFQINPNRIFFRSTTQPLFSLNSQQNSHNNPTNAKIRKPKPTNKKESPSKVLASKVSLKNNFCQSLIRGYSLATDKHLANESFSNIEDNSCNRYYDNQEEEKLLGQKISYKNIDIDNTSENKGEGENISEIHAQNIFEDFQQRKNELDISIRNGPQNVRHQRSKKSYEQAAVDRNRLQVPKEQMDRNSNVILQKECFTIESPQKSESNIVFPLMLVGLAFLLFLIQLAS